MSEDQISTPVFLAIIVILGFIVRYLFFNGAGANNGQSSRSPELRRRQAEIAVERIQQMFPQADRRSILWDLQRNGMNIQASIERLLAGSLETPPITFQPPPPPTANPSGASSATAPRQPEKPAQPDLITRYNLKNRLAEDTQAAAESTDKKGKGWSSNRDERQASLRKRQEEMILAARKRMEAKLASEGSGGTSA